MPTLADAGSFAAYVIGAPQSGGPLVSSAFGCVNLHLPGPTTPDGRRGHIGSVSTDVAARRPPRWVPSSIAGWASGPWVVKG